jgi:rubredoxin
MTDQADNPQLNNPATDQSGDSSLDQSSEQVFAPLDRHECRACGYVYEPTKGDSAGKISPMTRFEDLPSSWRCPVCGAKTIQFQNVGVLGKASGFTENLDYGLGINRLTPGQKNLLIFGFLALGIVFFISLYGLH